MRHASRDLERVYVLETLQKWRETSQETLVVFSISSLRSLHPFRRTGINSRPQSVLKTIAASDGYSAAFHLQCAIPNNGGLDTSMKVVSCSSVVSRAVTPAHTFIQLISSWGIRFFLKLAERRPDSISTVIHFVYLTLAPLSVSSCTVAS